MSVRQLGKVAAGSTIRFTFTTHTSAGANVAPSSAFEAADLRIYNLSTGSTTERSSAAGITMTSAFDGATGFHRVAIDSSENSDPGFYVDGKYEVWLTPDETIDSQAVSVVLVEFEIGSTPTVQDIVDAVLDELAAAHTTAGTVGKVISDTLNRLSTTATLTGTVQSDAGNSATQIKTNLTAAATDHYKDCLVKITSGTLAEQVKRCTGSTGTSNVVLTFASGFTGTPAAGVTFEIIND